MALSADHQQILTKIINGPTDMSSKGFPIIAEHSFHLFLENLPHLFLRGRMILEHIDQNLPPSTESEERAIKVLKTVVLTAAVTAPTDLWLMKHIISALHALGIIDQLLQGPAEVESLALSRNLDLAMLEIDLAFLRSRGYLVQPEPRMVGVAPSACVKSCLEGWLPYPANKKVDQVKVLAQAIQNPTSDLTEASEIMQCPATDTVPSSSWIPGQADIEIGSRLVPAILALRVSKQLWSLSQSRPFPPPLSPLFRELFLAAGLIDEENKVTLMGERVFSRAPGPMGIIHAYHSYLDAHKDQLEKRPSQTWVRRGANVAASQDANAKTFKLANDALDRFCADTGFSYSVFIEHAVGQGEATRQRFERSGEKDIRYFGADLEDAAIDKAIEEQGQGRLPKNMEFIRKADIADPNCIIQGLIKAQVKVSGSVMVVGNGFHEARQQSNASMIDIFRSYCEAEILLIFTEESGLTDEDLLATGFNTYHAGFRYVHELSGQGLRPAYDSDHENSRLSWQTCAERGGYLVAPDYTAKTRTIYPHPREDGRNPAISITYFCVPKAWELLNGRRPRS